ncbi:MAG: hypothetical protein JSR33_00430 [Proteobacteria bacterium]|nr:hypothetical protein [Pseudomonadota bacterium]
MRKAAFLLLPYVANALELLAANTSTNITNCTTNSDSANCSSESKTSTILFNIDISLAIAGAAVTVILKECLPRNTWSRPLSKLSLPLCVAGVGGIVGSSVGAVYSSDLTANIVGSVVGLFSGACFHKKIFPRSAPVIPVPVPPAAAPNQDNDNDDDIALAATP